MDLRHLKYFLAVIDQGNYARAAAELGMSQSALTQSISGLGREVGTRLLDRGRFVAVPTDAGRTLAHRARLIVAETRVAALELEAFRSPSRGHVTIGSGKSIEPSFMAAVLSNFMRTRPAATITAIEGWSPEMYRSLLQGELDFVVSAPLPDMHADPEISQEILFQQKEFVLIGKRHPLMSRASITAAQIASCRWLVPPGDGSRTKMIREAFGRLGISPPTQFVRVNSVNLAATMITRGDVVSLGSLDVMGSIRPASEFAIVDIPGLTTIRPAFLARRRRGALTPLAEALGSAIKAAAVDYIAQSQVTEDSPIQLEDLRSGSDADPSARVQHRRRARRPRA